jgi:hypothetical protein
MFTRIRIGLGLTLLLSLIASVRAFAKGGFDFIAISGPNLKEEVRIADPALTEGFFAFANFYEDKTEAPADPGEGYEILRYYVDGKREIIFDRLHYYPVSGFVFYDGIENGESEYDGEWYTANPEIKSIFESTLSPGVGVVAPVEKKALIPASAQPRVEDSSIQGQPASPGFQSLPILITVVAAGLAALIAFAFVRRKTTTQ